MTPVGVKQNINEYKYCTFLCPNCSDEFISELPLLDKGYFKVAD